MRMRKWMLFLLSLLLSLPMTVTYAHMEGEKDMKGDHGTHHGMVHHSVESEKAMKKLHRSMAELNSRTDKIFHSIIFSNFGDLEESVSAIRNVANGLRDTFPHRNLTKLDEFKNLANALSERSGRFEKAVQQRDPMAISKSFGEVLSTCVECHIEFRDPHHGTLKNTRHHKESLFKVTDGGKFSVEMLVKGGKFHKGENRADIIIHDSKDADLEGGIVNARIWTLGKGIRTSPPLKVYEISGGRYRIKNIVPPGGVWGIYIHVTREGLMRWENISDEVVFLF